MQEEKVIQTENPELDKDVPEIDMKEVERIYRKMHTPWRRRERRIGRNEICPFCDSGKKFKNCECYEKYLNTPIYTINYD